MQAVRSYDELIRAINEETKHSAPANFVNADSLIDLLLSLEPVEKLNLFIVSAEPVVNQSTSPMGRISNPSTWDYDDTESNYEGNRFELDLVALSNRLEEYFSWFGAIETIYLLGTSVAVFKMKHAFSVTHILRSTIHEVNVPESVMPAWPECSSILHPGPGRMMKANLTVHAYESDSLSLNTILSLLKHVDPAEVLMVRRVNRLGFNGKSLVRKHFEQFGKVLRVFMLPLRSRKKNVTLPSKTGFIVMADAACCEVILRNEEHTILPGLSVSVGPFTHRGLVTNTW
jgi:hypothetical protein